MDKATSLHTSVPTPPPRLYLPRNFSCSACLYGSLAEHCKGDCSPEREGAPSPTPVVREAAAAAGEKPQPSRGREPSVPPVPPSPTLRRRAKSLPTPGERSLRPALQQSPSRRKTVRFADSLGLELISVRHFCEADLPQVPLPLPARAADLFKTRKPPALGELEPVLFGPSPLLEPLFPPQPGASPGFAERVRRHKETDSAKVGSGTTIYAEFLSVNQSTSNKLSCAAVAQNSAPKSKNENGTSSWTLKNSCSDHVKCPQKSY
ncbi:protein phosphatase 1 regulatory subunit 3E-like isoform X2 [Malaclemys terrapin pileata]|uniref:protein phosphatase 1 regulatory subunit 3E-like isoform X2 n=1 Tax=Malaclemys terrapin pileata TaxID=2991368 RepID=UPI0023A8543C|nr:protein phosphatase 1 regulatory subunit 3E-like isoform X2 [Malaclemys terrapin pileata]